MEVDSEEPVAQTEQPVGWDIDQLKSVRYEQADSVIFARSLGISQRSYSFHDREDFTLSIRRTKGIPIRTTVADLIWMLGQDNRGNDLYIGLDPSYIYDMTGCLIKPRMLEWNHPEIVPFFDIASAVVAELSNLIDISTVQLLESISEALLPIENYLAVDYQNSCKAIIVAKNEVLDDLEMRAKSYCSEYWRDFQSMGKKIRLEFFIHLTPLKKYWRPETLSSLEEGDLISIQNFSNASADQLLRGTLQFSSKTKHRYEVFLQMEEDKTTIHFGSDELNSVQEFHDEDLPPHEQIELEVYAGKTKIMFDELCSVQEGTLIELREHALPIVTLCVQGTPILEGELVHFQNQLMVQVIRRLD